MATPTPAPTYDISILFRRAENLPIADLDSLSSDPYVSAALHTLLSDRDPDRCPPLRFRTPTERRTTDPEWEWRWDVSNVPRAGTVLRIHLLDEDCRDHDDRLGQITVDFAGLASWGADPGEGEWYKLKKGGASKKAAVLRLCVAGVKSGEGRTARVLVRIEVRGETKLEKERDVGRAFTLGPNCWSKHKSPLIGKVIHSKDSPQPLHSPQKAAVFSFEANKLQLTGPLPPALSHPYVGFAPFVTAYFTRTGLRGWLLHHALHSQYNSIYSHDTSTEYGVIDTADPTALARRFLEMVHWSEGHRVFTYVITLDAEWHFTETGDEFAIDLLSKHSLHSDVSRVIAYSGEFFVRRWNPDHQHQHQHQHDEIDDQDPRRYELVIDNDSGTYRPKEELLPQLAAFLKMNLRGLGAVTTFGCFDEALAKLKRERKEAKHRDGRRVFRQRSISSSGSISSSDEEELETGREGNPLKRLKGRFIMGGAARSAGAAAAAAAK